MYATFTNLSKLYRTSFLIYISNIWHLTTAPLNKKKNIILNRSYINAKLMIQFMNKLRTQ